MLKQIVDNWSDDNKIKKEIISISNKMDDPQDELFQGFNKINAPGVIENDFTKEVEADKNNNIHLNATSDSVMGSSDDEIEKEESKSK